jgi:hypothetical protein
MYVTISSGDTVSGVAAIRGGRIATLWAPTVTSCDLQLQASWDTTSANFADLFALDGTWRWKCEIGVGGVAMPLNDVVSVPYLRLETSVAQADVRTFVIGVKL